MSNYYIGVISEVVDNLTYEVKVDIPGIVEKKTAFPLRGEVDEPVVGDSVLLRNIDPLYMSVYLYSKVKEDEFIGFRSNGKTVSITPEYIRISVGEKESEEFHTHITLYDSGEMEITTKDSLKINISGETSVTTDNNVSIDTTGSTTIKSSGDLSIDTTGSTDIKSSGNITIDGPKIQLSGLKAIPGTSGSLNCVPVCPFTGVNHYLDYGIK